MTQLTTNLIRRARKIFVPLSLAMLGGLLWVAGAAAHGVDLLESDPSPGATLAEPPSSVRAQFSGELMAGDSILQVFSSEGKQVDNRDGGLDLNDPGHQSMIVSLPPLPDDIYTVRWFAALQDGDGTEGLFRFTVGSPAVAPNEVALPEPLSVDDGNGLPVVVIAAVLGGVSLLVLVVVFRRRLLPAR